ncbi:MAG: penicillin-binding protein 2 [Acidobacteriota bacterium]|nr:penicillin-binding protein 2 [Acidobacteriota bacterium]
MEARFPQEPRFPGWKIPFLQFLIIGTILALLAGYWRLQITHHRQYVEESERNRTRDLPIIAPRGRILDRNGQVLVDNYPAFSVLLSRESKLTPQEIAAIARGLALDPSDLSQQLQQVASLPRYQPVVIKQSATMQDVSFVESHRTEFPGLDLIQTQQRFYPKHTVAAALLGYVGDVSAETVAKSGARYHPGDVVGKTGIEREYNSVLTGQDGMKRVVVNSRGEEVGTLKTIEPHAGHDLRLTIDLDLQMAAEEALGDRNGAVVALDPRTGQVLAMVSHPGIDPNVFAHHIDAKTWEQLISDPEKPIMNKAIQAQLAPGSVFKIAMAVAALQSGEIKPSFTVRCPGYANFYGHTYHDWTFWKEHRGHGVVDLHRAIVISCDVYFYTLGKMLGIDTIARYAKALGLGSKTGIDLPGEEPGLIPTPEWVEKRFHHKWYAGETISVAIGQGAVAVTPLQLAEMIGGVAWGGIFYRPHVAFREGLERLGIDPPSDGPRRFPLSPMTVQAVTNGMWGVVNQGGTGARARVAGLDIAGKTGTAQVVSVALERSGHTANYKNNAWFVGYSPSPDPEIVVSALVMHGEESSVAAPIVGSVIKAYYQEYHPQDLAPGRSTKPPVLTTRQAPASPQNAVRAGVLP